MCCIKSVHMVCNRRILSNFRWSSHCLNFKKVRYKTIYHNLRFCEMCLKRNIHGFHLLMVCPVHEELRTLYFDAKRKSLNPTKELCNEIMADPRPMSIKSFAKYLVESFNIRKLSYTVNTISKAIYMFSIPVLLD